MVEIENSKNWDFDETELRLGLSCGGGGGDAAAGGEKSSFNNGKRVYEETVDLKLNIGATEMEKKNRPSSNDPMKPPAKAQVVGWPPVRSYRKNIMAVQKGGDTAETEKSGTGGGAALVKVSMDGAPYLRKVDLKMYTTYQQLSDALGKMFGSFSIGECERQGCMLDLMNERCKLMDLLNGSDYVPTYEDKDGDWMLVGDVPWEMFVESCKRLRIMKGTEAKGLAMEKCKRRS